MMPVAAQAVTMNPMADGPRARGITSIQRKVADQVVSWLPASTLTLRAIRRPGLLMCGSSHVAQQPEQAVDVPHGVVLLLGQLEALASHRPA